MAFGGGRTSEDPGREHHVPGAASRFAEADAPPEHERPVRQRPDCDVAASRAGSERVEEDSGDAASGTARTAGTARESAVGAGDRAGGSAAARAAGAAATG